MQSTVSTGADEHAKNTLPKHWETFASFSCESIITNTNDFDHPSNSVALYQISPNPVNSITTISFKLSKPLIINIGIYDSLGKNLKGTTSEEFSSGFHQIQLDMTEFPDGVYYYRLESDSQIYTKKILVLRS